VGLLFKNRNIKKNWISCEVCEVTSDGYG
jgi:hypothetical protein